MSALAAALAAVLLNHAVFAAAAFPLWLWAGWIVFAGACLARGKVALRLDGTAERPTLSALGLGLIALVPVALPLATSWEREFGFGGDASFHIGVTFRLALWWASAPFATPSDAFDPAALDALRASPWRILASRATLLALGVACFVSVYRRMPRAALAVATLALFAWGIGESAREFRYPALAYHAAFPFLIPAALLGAPELAFRLSGVAAVAAWLFLLRPWLLKRWPDFSVLAVCAFLFWNDAFLAVLDAAYLEPWAIVFLALAAEARVRGGIAATPLACVLVGVAAAAKEPAIFVLPFLWLSALPWRDPRGQGADTTLAAFAAGLPFLAFFAANRTLGQVRPVSFGMPDASTFAGLVEYAERFAQSGGGWAVLGLAVALVALFRARAWACAAAGAFLILFFVVERGSLGYAGIPRFLWLAFPLLAAGLFAREGRIVALAMCLVQTPGIVAAIERARADHAARSFAEYYDAPFVFPIKSLLREAGLDPASRVTVRRPDPAFQPGAAMGRPGSVLDFVDDAPCLCAPGGAAILVLAPPETGFWARGATPPVGTGPDAARLARWRAARDDMPSCRASLEASCPAVLTRAVDGRDVALLGLGQR